MYEYARRTKPTELTEAPTKVKQPTEKQNGETTD